MRLNIYSLQGIEFEGEIKSLNIKTRSGEITVLDHHRPLITILNAGTAKILTNGDQKKEFKISSGLLEVNQDNKAEVLLG